MSKRFFLLLVSAMVSFRVSAQTATPGGWEWFAVPSVNLVIPLTNTQKGTFPVLWYDNTVRPALMLGGTGTGIAMQRRIGGHTSVKLQGNLYKQTYWEEPFDTKDGHGVSRGMFLVSSSDLRIGLTGMVRYSPDHKFYVGIGAGLQALLISLTQIPVYKMPDYDLSNRYVRNRHYRPVVPAVPLEISYRLSRTYFAVRYEQGLVNQFRGDLGRYKSDYSGLLSMEMGIRFY